MTVQSDTVLYRNGGFNADPQSSAVNFTTATPVQVFTDRDCVVYVELDSAAGSSPVVAIGPDDTTAVQVAGAAIAASTGIVVTVVLPAAWFIQLTFTSDITVTAVVVTD